MKTAEELNDLKEEVETLNKKLNELTNEELEQVGTHTELRQLSCQRPKRIMLLAAGSRIAIARVVR